MAGGEVKAVMQSSQQQQKQPEKDKKTPKESSVAAVPATSGVGLFYRAQLQVQPCPAERQAMQRRHAAHHLVELFLRFF